MSIHICVQGDFQVLAINACPPIEAGPGRVLTGVFRFSRGSLYNVWVTGEAGPIGATAEHPVWSVDRQDWVAVKDLRIGEQMQGVNGTAMTLAVEAAAEEAVFNVEVDADHCYRVGRLGLVVHNASCKRTGCGKSKGSGLGQVSLILNPPNRIVLNARIAYLIIGVFNSATSNGHRSFCVIQRLA